MNNERGSSRAIGLFGGSFDPIHNGHLRVAVEAAECLNLDEIRLLPLNTPGHREDNQAPASHRAEMVKIAAQGPLVLDGCEIERGGVTYTVDTLTLFRERFPNATLYLILGLDAYYGLPDWHRPEAVLELAHIVVAARPNAGAGKVPGLDALIGNAHCEDVAEFRSTRSGHVFFLDSPLMPIASSDLRQRLREGRSIRYLVPATVADYIDEHRLYNA